MSKFTPGPWEVVPLSGISGPYAIRMHFSPTQTFYGVQQIARKEDARLIAAAPDLYRALKECYKYFYERPGNWEANIRPLINEALAKAEGREESE